MVEDVIIFDLGSFDMTLRFNVDVGDKYIKIIGLHC